MGTPLRFKRIGGGAEREVELVSVSGSALTARIDGQEISGTIESRADGSAILALGGHRYHISGSRRANAIVVAAGPLSAEYQIVETRRRSNAMGLASPSVDAPMPGTVLKILVEQGARVETNDPLIVLEAMKTETTLMAESPAMIKRVCVQVGQKIDHGATLIELAPVESPKQE
jgi:3-methylcrotonyl-CoA carboxylase alpha subunit